MENKNKNAVVIIIGLVAGLSIGIMTVRSLDKAYASSTLDRMISKTVVEVMP